MEQKMTEGAPLKLISRFAIPIVFGLLFQQVYNLVDSIIVGQILGVNELAAVGMTGSISFLIIGFCVGTSTGFAIPVAQLYGAGDDSGMRRYYANSLWLSGIFSIVTMVPTLVMCGKILCWIHTPAELYEPAYEYIFIIMCGIPVTYFYNLFVGIMRSLGNSKTPVYFITFASVLNVFLDLFFILVFHAGVAGAALATVLSQAVSASLCAVYMAKKYSILHFEKDEWKPRKYYLKKLCVLGTPMGFQYSITAIGSVILQSAVNGLGAQTVAAVTAATKISNFFVCFFDAVGTTMTTYGGQNAGAGRWDRMPSGLKAAFLISGSYALAMLFVLSVTGERLLGIFFGTPEELVIKLAQQYMMINVIFYIFLAVLEILRFFIQGVGYSKAALISGGTEMVVRTVFGLWLVPKLGFGIACYSNAIAWIFADLFLIPLTLWILKKGVEHEKIQNG